MQQQPVSTDISKANWLAFMQANWKQGEHVAIVGPTGTGKTTIAKDLLLCRDYVCVLAVKRHDDTLNLFRTDYRVIKKWPPEYDEHRVVLWLKPENFGDIAKQSVELHHALEQMYKSGGWCIYFDEAGYIAGHLRLAQPLGILLNQGRSSHLSVVCSMTRPRSMVARIPTETLNQCRHLLIFRYTDEREIKAIAEIAGTSYHEMQELQDALGDHDFVYIGKKHQLLIRNN